MVVADLHMRHTGTDGRSHVAVHRVWDASRFAEARALEAARENAMAGTDKAKAEVISRDEYMDAKGIRKTS